MPRVPAASRYQRDRQLRQKPARFIRSRFCTSVRSRRCCTRRRKDAASSSVVVLSSIALSVAGCAYCGGAARQLLVTLGAIDLAPREDRAERRCHPLGTGGGAGVGGDEVL